MAKRPRKENFIVDYLLSIDIRELTSKVLPVSRLHNNFLSTRECVWEDENYRKTYQNIQNNNNNNKKNSDIWHLESKRNHSNLYLWNFHREYYVFGYMYTSASESWNLHIHLYRIYFHRRNNAISIWN